MSEDVLLDDCGCCDDDALTQPANRPGLTQVSYRVGTHSSFLRRMKTRISSWPDPPGSVGKRPLARLTTRSLSDPTIALLDAWAVTADVLTFYQERIANEGYLRTATERRSILELARAIGYELNPGRAARTELAFIVEEAEGAPHEADIPTGTQVQSLPAPGKLPQPFETGSDLHARAEWNRLIPPILRPQVLARKDKSLYLEGVATQLQRGDYLLIVGDERLDDPAGERWDVRVLTAVTADTVANRTLAQWAEGLGHGYPRVDPATSGVRVYAFRQRAALFGHNAPQWLALPLDTRKAFREGGGGTEWPDLNLRKVGDDFVIDLDQAYAKIVQDSWLALLKPDPQPYTELYQAKKVETGSRADFMLTGKVTRIVPDTQENLSRFSGSLRETLVLTQSEELPLALIPNPTPIQECALPLGTLLKEPLPPGKLLLVTGREHGSAADSPILSEAVTVESYNPGTNTIQLTARLTRSYARASVVIYANVAPATHGATVREVLGSGNAANANQQFKLKKPPLTYVLAANPRGSDSTLTVRVLAGTQIAGGTLQEVGAVRWQEVAALYQQPPSAQVYTVRLADDGTPTVIFGDGSEGARLPSGQENVTAIYRSGSGPDGNVAGSSLSLLPSRPYGVREVTNPAPAVGGTAPEQLANARQNAPLTVLTLDRIVSLRDYDDFARSFAGVGKAQVTSRWVGERQQVGLIVADAAGAVLDAATKNDLSSAIKNATDPNQRFELVDHLPLTFRLEVGLVLDTPRYLVADVRAAVERELRAAFAFAARNFNQPVTAAEVVATIQRVPGVIAVDLDRLYLSGDPGGSSGTTPPTLLPTSTPRRNGSPAPGWLLLLDNDPTAIKLTEAAQ